MMRSFPKPSWSHSSLQEVLVVVHNDLTGRENLHNQALCSAMSCAGCGTAPNMMNPVPTRVTDGVVYLRDILYNIGWILTGADDVGTGASIDQYCEVMKSQRFCVKGKKSILFAYLF